MDYLVGHRNVPTECCPYEIVTYSIPEGYAGCQEGRNSVALYSKDGTVKKTCCKKEDLHQVVVSPDNVIRLWETKDYNVTILDNLFNLSSLEDAEEFIEFVMNPELSEGFFE